MFRAKIPDYIRCVWDIQFVSLSLIADVHADLVVDCAFPFLISKIRLGPAAQCAKLAIQPLTYLATDEAFARNSQQHGARVILHHVTDQDAKGREGARQRGNDHSWNTESFRQLAGMQAARSAESHQRELSRVITLLD